MSGKNDGKSQQATEQPEESGGEAGHCRLRSIRKSVDAVYTATSRGETAERHVTKLAESAIRQVAQSLIHPARLLLAAH
jgi:hypothetical protein